MHSQRKTLALSGIVAILAIGLVAGLVSTFPVEAESQGQLLGMALTPSEMAAAEGQAVCGQCVKSGTVCGFWVVGDWEEGHTTCTGSDTSNCKHQDGWEAFECDVTFTDRYTCTGGTPDPYCNPWEESIQCGARYKCTILEYTCAGGHCIVTGVSACSEVDQCGQFASCD